jgi:transposase
VLASNPALDFWSLDECHFQQHGSRCVMWVPPEETDPVVFHAPTRKSVALFGAVNLHRGQMMAHFNPVFEAQSFLAFLKALLRRRAHGKKMMLITDNAAYHHAAGLDGWLQENRNVLELLFLPPYSPELNPIERVWKLLRRLCTHNEYFPELELLENALTRQLRQWWKPNAVLRRLCCIT